MVTETPKSNSKESFDLICSKGRYLHYENPFQKGACQK